MAINYSIRPSILQDPAVPGLQMIQSATALNVDKDRLVREIGRQSTIARAADISAMLDNLGIVIASFCSNGQSVEIPHLGKFIPRVRGTATDKGEWIRHPEAYMTFRFNKKLVEAFGPQVQMQQTLPNKIRPTIGFMMDGATLKVNEVLTPGGVLAIKGRNLKSNISKSDEGVWFMPVDQSGTAVKVSHLVDNTYSRLTCEIPAELQAGTQYRVEIRTRIKSSKILSTSACDTVLIVA